ncbi:MAG: hypothetical protein HMLIMOIP_002606 [Candidatus Nitrosomirales archaeon]|jgi:hypothetical protein
MRRDYSDEESKALSWDDLVEQEDWVMTIAATEETAGTEVTEEQAVQPGEVPAAHARHYQVRI